MPLYGTRRHSTWALDFCKRNRGRQSKDQGNRETTSTFIGKGIRSFLGHAGFYRWFIKDFSRIVKPLSSLLVQGTPFDFDEQCVQEFSVLKDRLVSAPIIVTSDWDIPFELICDASDYAIGAVLGHKRKRIF